MERLIYRFLRAWVLLLGGAWLMQYFGWSKLAYWLFVPVVVALPLVMLVLLGQLVLRAREIWWRIRRLRRASKWKRWRSTDTSWQDDEMN